MDFASNFLGIIASIVTIGTFVFLFFRWYFEQHSSPVLFLVCAVAAPVIGGLFWNVLCKLKNWPYHMGGSGNEPHGWHAFTWGIITIFPVVFLGVLVGRKLQIGNWSLLLKWLVSTDLLVIMLYTIFSGFGAIAFYDSGVRPFIEAMDLGYAKQEIAIVLLWSAIISTASYLAYLVLFPLHNTETTTVRLLLQIPFAVLLSALAVLFFLCVAAYTQAFDQLKGFAAGFALRFGLFCGIVYGVVSLGLKSALK